MTTGWAARTISRLTGCRRAGYRGPSGLVRDIRANRAFLARAVRFLAGEAGVRQFLDIGTGIPAADNTHEVAQAVAPESRIVYVDNDPIVLAHARALLASTPEGATAYLTPTCGTRPPILRAGGADAGLHPAGRADAARHPAPGQDDEDPAGSWPS